MVRHHVTTNLNHQIPISPHSHHVDMKDRTDVTVPMPAALVDQVDEQLSYGDSRAEWIREAIRQRLEREEMSEGNRSQQTTSAD